MMDRAEAIKWLSDTELLSVLPGRREALQMAIAALREQDATDINVGNKWISVKERLPDENEMVLAWVAPCGDLHFCFGCELTGFEVTHWMPLPEPPKEGAE
jgi:hypothetical protein